MSIGFSQSLHLTMPNSGLSGSAPKTFMFFASSHCVGGDPGSEVELDDGDVGKLSHEKAALGEETWFGLSLSAMGFLRDMMMNSIHPLAALHTT